MRRIQIRRLSKRFGTVTALTGLDLQVEAGETLVILGPSGSGKSTLLRLIAGLERADEGDILFDGQSQLAIPPHQRGVAMVFQNFALYPHLSAAQNIMIGLRYGLKLSKEEARQRVLEVARRLEIEELLDRRPGEMSGGQRQRVALGRALARRAGIILLDEPLSGLDAQLRQALRIEIKTLLHTIGATALLVTHDQLDAMAIGDRIAVMRAGRIEQIGTPEEIYSLPSTTFVARFIGSPPMNLLPARVETGQVRSPVMAPFPAPAIPPGPVLIGIRPEHLRPEGAGPLTLKGKILTSELSGGEWVLHLQVGDSTLAARCQLKERPRMGEQISLSTQEDHVLFFNPDDGQRLAPGTQ